MSGTDAPPEHADHVVGVFARDGLSSALASTHRAGFGPQTRVLDGARGDPARQLERAGLQLVSGERPSADAVLVVVTAPGRTTKVADLFRRLGAVSVQFASRRGAEPKERAEAPVLLPDIRIVDDRAATSGA
jgi:hypothetical protein